MKNRIDPPAALPAMALVGGALALLPSAAEAHIKWFGKYVVGAPPAPISATLANGWFWLAIVLALTFFLATLAVERTTLGERVLTGLDKLSAPLWGRLDDLMRAVIAAFFVAIFAMGGVFLTPDLKTANEMVSWLQLLIALGIFWRRTMPFSAAAIVLLLVLALSAYELFHILDYLAFALGVAGYLVLAASNNPEWRKHRFDALCWGMAVALMWSSLEKFAYAQWFYPLIEQKPFLTFDIPQDRFIPMAGVAEFTMGLGLLWTPLVRRLSGIALVIIFSTAAIPFGRIDAIGHSIFIAIAVCAAVNPTREQRFLPALKRRLAVAPVGLAAALTIFVTSYWGLHIVFYGPNGAAGRLTERLAEVGSAADTRQGTPVPGPATEAFEATMTKMHPPMMAGLMNPDPDVAFVLGMIPHHQGAVDMAKVELRYGSDPANHHLATEIIQSQMIEIQQMRRWLQVRQIQPPDSK